MASNHKPYIPTWLRSPRVKGYFPILTVLAGWIVNVNAASFKGLGDLPGGNTTSVAMAVSADGKTVVGYSSSTLSGTRTEAFRWTAGGGMVPLGDLAGGVFNSVANAVSADGTVVVGNSTSTSGVQAFRWTSAGGMVGLGDLPGGNFSSLAYGVSSNGQVVVGYSSSTASGTSTEAFRWTAADGMVGIGVLPGASTFTSRAWAVSGDGSIVVGESRRSTGDIEAFRWSASSGMVGLGDFPSDVFNSIAYAISADGSVIGGRGYSGAKDSFTHEAFRWTQGAGLVQLGFIPCSDWSIVHAAAADGSILVGDPESNTGDCAFIWDEQHGMRNLHQVLTSEFGLNLTGWQLSGARGISSDGKVIAGFGINPSGIFEAWVAELYPHVLSTAISGTNVALSWPTNVGGFILETSLDLAANASWVPVTDVPSMNGDKYVVLQPVSGERKFFRLRKE